MIHLGNDVQHGTGDRTEIDSLAAYHQAILAQKVLLIVAFHVHSERLAGEREVIVGPGLHSQKDLDELLVLDLFEEGEPLVLQRLSWPRSSWTPPSPMHSRNASRRSVSVMIPTTRPSWTTGRPPIR